LKIQPVSQSRYFARHQFQTEGISTLAGQSIREFF